MLSRSIFLCLEPFNNRFWFFCRSVIIVTSCKVAGDCGISSHYLCCLCVEGCYVISVISSLISAALTQMFVRNVASIPVISENEARKCLTEFCDNKCCYGTGAARAMIINTMQSTSAFHVRGFCYLICY